MQLKYISVDYKISNMIKKVKCGTRTILQPEGKQLNCPRNGDCDGLDCPLLRKRLGNTDRPIFQQGLVPLSFQIWKERRN